MAIDPKLYEKYTGKRPGDAMTRMGQSLVRQSARGPAGDTSVLGSIARGRWYLRIAAAILTLIGVLYFIFAPPSW
jgi:hypothetical protein